MARGCVRPAACWWSWGTGWWSAGGPQEVASGPWLPKSLLRRGRAGSEAFGAGGGEWLEDKGPLSQAPPRGAGDCQPWEWDQHWGSCLWWCRTHPLPCRGCPCPIGEKPPLQVYHPPCKARAGPRGSAAGAGSCTPRAAKILLVVEASDQSLVLITPMPAVSSAGEQDKH